MIRNVSYLTDYEEIDEGYVAFGGNLRGGKITGKCTIRTGNLDFKNVYFVRELKFNLFRVNVVDETISIELLFDPNMPALEDVCTFDFSSDDEDDGVVADMNNLDTIIHEETKKVIHALKDPSWIEAMQEELLQSKLQEV
uniref:Ribonuclease H-like domain-containing protein n=1 Tax=Tanacetum cinerariifolium TaxID=118510 RepID=A0A699I8B3_TANCI|nr:ribonuclease H-like domain-containing protein [Tanacetum cinerariifolium]